MYLTTKAQTEGKGYPGIQERFSCCDNLVLVNFAGTSFFSNDVVSKAYTQHKPGKMWFYDRLSTGKMSCVVILTYPHGFAALDAAEHKMKPRNPNMPTEEIILSNIKYVCEFQKEHPDARLTLKLTNVCLPYGVALGTGSNSYDDVMKIDIYSPLKEYSLMDSGSGDDNKNSTEFTQPDIQWLTAPGTKHVVHRGRYSEENTGHNLNGFWMSLRAGLPIEADILELSDHSLIVGRDVTITSRTDSTVTKQLSALNLAGLRRLKDAEWMAEEGADSPIRLSELMTLEEFLQLVSGQVPLVLELKLKAADSPEGNIKPAEELAEKVLRRLRYYQGKYVIVAANPYILKAVRDRDPMIPVGQITWEFTGWDGREKDYYLKLHRNMTFMEIIRPDVILKRYSEVMPRRNSKSGENGSVYQQDIFNLGIPVVLWANYKDSRSDCLDREDMDELGSRAANYIVEARPDLYKYTIDE